MRHPLLSCVLLLLMVPGLAGCATTTRTWDAQVVLEVDPAAKVRVHQLSCPGDTRDACTTQHLLHDGEGPAQIPLANLRGNLWLRVTLFFGADQVTAEHGLRAEGPSVQLVYAQTESDGRPHLNVSVQPATLLHESVVRPV